MVAPNNRKKEKRKMADIKSIVRTMAIFAISGVLFFSSTRYAVSVAPPQRGDECTLNSNLLRAYPTTWDNYTWIWGFPLEGRWSSDSKLFSEWPSNGVAHLRCEDGTPSDGFLFASNFEQTSALGMTSVDFATTKNMWLEASITNITGAQCPWEAASWTGGKFDIVAVEKGGTGRMIMMEMYMWRTGANTVWGDDLARQTSIGSSVWNYLVALDHMRSNYGNGLEIEWDANGQHYFEVNVLELLRIGIFKINAIQPVGGLPVLGYPPNPPFDISNFVLTRVDFALEAGYMPIILPSTGPPWVETYLNSLRLRYNTADTNGDGKVDLKDVSFVARKFGLQFGNAGYDFRADLNTDGIVNMIDVATVAAAFGKTY